jgi:hypothetical protein
MFTCKLCGYETDKKHCLVNHLKRKVPCISLDISSDFPSREELIKELEKKYNDITFDCKWCNKKFNHKNNMYVHQKNCKNNNNEVDDLKNAVKILTAELSEMKAMKTSNMTNNGTINNNIQNNNVTINLRSFGFENISHLENDMEYMTQCFMNKDVMRLLENIHCDKKHPENQNVRVKSTKRELMETYEDGRWLVSDQDDTLDELLNKGYRILNMFSHRNRRHLINECEDGESEYHELKGWLEDLYSDSRVRKPLKKRLLILFLNNKTVFLEKDENVVIKPTIKKNDENKREVKHENENKKEYNKNEDNDNDSSGSDIDPNDYEEMSPEEASKYTMVRWSGKCVSSYAEVMARKAKEGN